MSIHLYPALRVVGGGGGAYPSCLRVEAGFTLDKSAAHHRETNSRPHSHSPACPVNPVCLWTVEEAGEPGRTGENRHRNRENMPTQKHGKGLHDLSPWMLTYSDIWHHHISAINSVLMVLTNTLSFGSFNYEQHIFWILENVSNDNLLVAETCGCCSLSPDALT